MKPKDKSILYLEDDLILASSVCRILSLLFKKVVHCTNGCDGLNEYHKNKFDLILSDVNMPMMNGIEFSKEIRSIDEHIPIFLHSSFQKKMLILKKLI